MKFITKHSILILLLLVTFLGGVLRFWNLGTTPPSLNWDEVSHGYNAYSILKTGMDEWGVRFPLIFRAFGDFKLPVYIYLSVIPVWLFGLNAFSVRFISALAGTLAIPGIYLLAKQLFPAPRNRHLVLITSFLLAVCPWHFFISRPALEANLSLTLMIFGFYYLLRFFNKKASFLPSTILLGLSLHTYNTARVFVPLLLLVTIFIYRLNIKSIIVKSFATWQSRTLFLTSVLIFIFFISIVGVQIFSGDATARYNKLQILSESVVFQIGEARSESNLPSILPKLLYNRPVYFVKTFAKNYLNYFSPQFFFQSSGSQSQFAIPQANLLTIPVMLLCLIGFYVSFKNAKQTNFQFLLSWLLLSPVAAALTIDPPQALRPNPMIPALIILASIGLVFILEKTPHKYSKIALIAILATVLISFSAYLYKYNNNYHQKYSQSWQYGYSQVMDFVRFYKKDYTNIFVTKRLGEPHMFYAFYNSINPKEIQPSPNNIRFKRSDWFWTDKIDNIYFVNDWQIPTTTVSSLTLESGLVVPSKNSILITSPDHVPVNAHVIDTVNFLDGTPAFIITSIP